MVNTIKDLNLFINQFYSVKRLNCLGVYSGPFDFDIHKAYDFCSIIESNNIDTIIETGTNNGDTSEFLAKRYPNKKIITCEIEKSIYEVAKLRLKKYKNVNVFLASSEFIVRDVNQLKHNIIYYLDAHFYDYWPLRDELHKIKRGFVMIDDFNIGCSNYRYGGEEQKMITEEKLKCDKNLVKLYAQTNDLYINNVLCEYPIPNHQLYKNSGRCFYQKQFNSNVFKNKNFRKLY